MSQRSILTIKYKGESITLVHDARDLAVSQNVGVGRTLIMTNGTAAKALRTFVNFFSGWRKDMIQEVIDSFTEQSSLIPNVVSFSEIADTEESEIYLEISVSREARVEVSVEAELELEHE